LKRRFRRCLVLPGPSRRRLLGELCILVTALVAFGGACAASSRASDSRPAGDTLAACVGVRTTSSDETVDDWTHCLQVVADLRAQPPERPLILLLGGSAARECTINDVSWAAEIQVLGGPDAVAYNLGSDDRATAADVELVKALPRVPAIVFIGVSLSRFTSSETTATVELPAPGPLSPYMQHEHSSAHIRPLAKKRRLAERWMKEVAPSFDRSFATGTRMLQRLVKVCRGQGLHPVLLELPRDAVVTDRVMKTPVVRCHRACLRMAREQGVPFVNLNREAHLENRDFYDLWHLVEPGRAKWQRHLSRVTVDLLRRYVLDRPLS
jgi:hypothetical protein